MYRCWGFEIPREISIADRKKSAQRRRKHCALAVVRQSQKISPLRKPPSRRRGTATSQLMIIAAICLLAGLPASTLAPLQRVLRVAARVVLDLKPRDHISSALRELH